MVAGALVSMALVAAGLTQAPTLWDLPVAALLAALLVMSTLLVGSGIAGLALLGRARARR